MTMTDQEKIDNAYRLNEQTRLVAETRIVNAQLNDLIHALSSLQIDARCYNDRFHAAGNDIHITYHDLTSGEQFVPAPPPKVKKGR